MREIIKIIRDKWVSYFFIVAFLAVGFVLINDRVIWNVVLDGYCPYFSVSQDELELGSDSLKTIEQQFNEQGYELAVGRWCMNLQENTMHFYIYGSDRAIKEYKEAVGFSSDCLNSIFSRNYSRSVRYHFGTLEQVAADSLEKAGEFDEQVELIILSQNGEDVAKTISPEWYWSLGLKNFHGNHYTLWKEVKSQVIGIWVILLVAISFLQYYDVVRQKKCYFVEIAYGTTVGEVILRNVAADTLFYVFCIIGMCASVRYIFYLPFGDLPYIIIGGIMIVGNIIWYLTLLRYSFRDALSGTRLTESELAISYLLRMFVMVSVIVFITLSCFSGAEYVRLKRSQAFFREHKEWYATTAQSLSDWEAWYDYYLKAVADGTAEKYMIQCSFTEGRTTYTIIENGSNSLQWLMEWYPSVDFTDREGYAWLVLYPEALETEACRNAVRENYPSEKGAFLYLPYKEKQYALVDKNTVSCGTNLIFVVDLHDSEKKNLGNGLVPEEIFQAYFRIPDSDSDGRIRLPNGEMVETVSLYEEFMREYVKTRNLFLGELVSMLLFLLMKAVITGRILYLEFDTDSVRYIIMRINGTGFIQTYRYIFLTAIVSGVIGFAVDRMFMKMSLIPDNKVLGVAVALGVVGTEVGMIVYRIIRLEHTNVQRILKGGKL